MIRIQRLFAVGSLTIALIALIAIGSAGCSTNVDKKPGEMKRYTLQHGGLAREYFVFLPSTYESDGKNPATLFLHGYGGTATGTESEVARGLNRYAEDYGYVMVYPQGTWFMAGDTPETQWEATSWNHISDGFDTGPSGPICTAEVVQYPCPPECGTCGQCGWTSCHDDIGFLRLLVATLSRDLQINRGEFFVSGFSNGAMMANRIACEASELFAGAVLVAGRVEPGFECTPTKRLPLLQINGGADETVPFDGRVSYEGYFYASTASVAGHWNDGQACSLETENWTSKIIDGENVKCSSSCGGTEFETIDCVWPEGNHRWPGTAGFLGSDGYCVTELQSASMPDRLICVEPDSNADYWGSALMFEFFDAQRVE